MQFSATCGFRSEQAQSADHRFGCCGCGQLSHLIQIILRACHWQADLYLSNAGDKHAICCSMQLHGSGLGAPESMLGSTLPPPPRSRQTRLRRSGVPHDTPLEGHLLGYFAVITPGSARSFYFIFILFYSMQCVASGLKRRQPVISALAAC